MLPLMTVQPLNDAMFDESTHVLPLVPLHAAIFAP